MNRLPWWQGRRGAALLLLAAALLLRVKTFGNPAAGFDDQWYLLVGDRLLHGQLPYVDLFDRKPFGLFLLFAGVRLLGGDGILQMQLVATGFAAATAWVIFAIARRHAPPVPGLLAGVAYLAWLNIMEGDGGQSPVFYNLPIAVGGWLTAMTLADRRDIGRRGVAVMLLAGLAMQIKYNALAEGVLFGCALLWAGWRRGLAPPLLAGWGFVWVMVALAPTILASFWFWWLGHWDVYVFANFVSIFGQALDDRHTTLVGAAALTAILLPLLVASGLAARRWCRESVSDERRFLIAWAVVAVAWIYAFGRFGSPHYGLPALVPLAAVGAAGVAGRRPLRIAVIVVALFAAIGLYVIWSIDWRKGTRATVDAIVAASTPRQGCIYVFDGLPILYHLAHSCLPTRYTFPSHLNWVKEARSRSLGVDPMTELARVLDSRPGIIIDDWPIWDQQNPAARTLLNRTLACHYRRVASIAHGSDRRRLVYRLSATPGPGCPR